MSKRKLLNITLVALALLFAAVFFYCRTLIAERRQLKSYGTPRSTQDLEFSSPRLESLFQRFDRTAEEYCGADFDRQPYAQGGNFLRSTWRKNAEHPTAPLRWNTREGLKDVQRVSVDAMVYSLPSQRAFGAAIGVEYVSADPDRWSATLSYRDADKNGVTGAHWHVSFFRWDAAKFFPNTGFRPLDHRRDSVMLPTRGYGVADSGVHFRTDRGLEEDFLHYLRSAETMRDAYLADLAELEGRARALITSHSAVKSVSGPYLGNGLPPQRHPEPLTAQEELAELQKLDAYFTRQRQLMETEYQAMYSALREAFPWEKVWPELAE